MQSVYKSYSQDNWYFSQWDFDGAATLYFVIWSPVKDTVFSCYSILSSYIKYIQQSASMLKYPKPNKFPMSIFYHSKQERCLFI